jgi:hypothetical protein
VFTWLLLPGCPFVFGPPDLSNVPGSAPSTDGEPDTTETGTGPPDPTGDTGPPPVPPEITDARVDRNWEGFTFRVAITDPDGDLSGGRVVVDDGDGVFREMFVPYDVSIVGGQARFVIETDEGCASWDHAFEITIHDAAGNSSEPAVLITAGTGGGEAEEAPFPVVLGTVEPVFATCGGFYGNGDRDQFAFGVATAGRMTLSLTWNTAADVDFDLYRNGTLWGGAYGIVQPEVLERQFDVGLEYVIDLYKVPSANPAPDSYQLLLLPSSP